MKKVFRVNKIMLIVGLVLTGLLFVGCAGKAPGVAPLVLQALDYTENPVDIPNPDRGLRILLIFRIRTGALKEAMTTLPAWEPLSLINREVQTIGGI